MTLFILYKLMLFIILTTLFTIGLTKKIYDFMLTINMNNLYLNLGFYGFKAYGYTYIAFQKINKFFKRKYVNVIITFIKNGNEVKECNIDQLKLYKDTINNYDLILYKDIHTTSDKYRYNILRLDKYRISNKYFNYNISNVRFADIQIIYKSNKYSVDFSKDNYYINGNILFDKEFVKWYLNSAYGILIDDKEEYTCTIMDQNINCICLDSSNKIVLEKDSYRVESSIICDDNIEYTFYI